MCRFSGVKQLYSCCGALVGGATRREAPLVGRSSLKFSTSVRGPPMFKCRHSAMCRDASTTRKKLT
jgi:hypothetical protein